ncbi:MAG: hypothetical protein Q8L40_09190 [Burkholderiales bacterium]|nr:hypothetical protein [Burkholderiales bacterium]
MKLLIMLHLLGVVVWVGGMFFAYVYAAPFAVIKRAVAAKNWKEGGAALNRIRIAVAVNLGLGLLNVVVATAGAM